MTWLKAHFPYVLLQSSVQTVCQQRSVLKSRTDACIGQFYKICACSRPAKSYVWRSFACGGRTVGGGIGFEMKLLKKLRDFILHGCVSM